MTWFQSLNPLFVMLLTPPLLAYWRRHSHKETQALAGPADGDGRVDRRLRLSAAGGR